MSDTGNQRLADLFEKLRDRKVSPTASYTTDDVIAVLLLLSKGYNVAEIERRTLISRPRITKWRDAFLDGYVVDLYPDLPERLAAFDYTLLPAEKVRRVRPMLAWHNQTRLEDRANPYMRTNGHGVPNA